jgi:outer membrane receptor protein involved in Fe transport
MTLPIRQRLLTTTLLVGAAALASPAQAQTTAPVDATPQKTAESEAVPPSSTPTNAEGQPEEKGAIVITGSRIRRDNFNTPQNVDILTRNDNILAGAINTGETLQSATVTSGTAQISGSYLGFVSEGGQAASTVGLRGLGSSRTLVLLNGRRLAPAGVGNQLVAADLNVLPTSVIQRIEVLREGASSIYGSDAIAGVINVVTDTSINGLVIDGFANHPLAGSGDNLRGSVALGKTFDRGHIMASFEVRKTDGLRVGDRDDYRCPRDLFYIGGQEVGQLDPTTGQLRCFPFAYDSLGSAGGYGISYNFNTGVLARITYPGYTTGQPDIFGAPVRVDTPVFPAPNPPGYDFRPSPAEVQLESHIISPTKTYTAYLNGAYDLGILGDAELYGEGLFTRRQSRQDSSYQLSFDTNQLGATVQMFGGHIGTASIDDAFGLSPIGTSYASPFFPDAWDAAGINYFNPLIVVNKTSFQAQKVDFFRGNVGLRGNLGIGDWQYDGNLQMSRTRSKENVWNPNTTKLTNALTAIEAPAGTPESVITVGLPGQTGAGIGYTCASNVTNGAYNGGECVPLNFYDPQVLIAGRFPDNVYNYIWQDNINRSRFDQDTAEFVVNGTLFSLPGGDVKAALGVLHRRDHIKDVPSEAALDGTLYSRAVAGITEGTDKLNEAFGEVSIPILRDRPFFQTLELDASGRYTHYKSYGSDFTYHLNAQWAPVREIRFRGNYGTNFRAPNLYEQFVAAQTGFYPPSFDPCDKFTTTAVAGQPLYDNCVASLSPILGNAGALGYTSTSGPEVTTTGGAGTLKAEHAKTWGVGAVITVPKRWADFSLAIDYWNIDVQDEVAILGSTILSLCYNSTDFPNNAYCALIGPRAAAGTAHPGALTTFTNPYLNVSKQLSSGIDFDARYATRLLGGRFQTQFQATRNLHQKLEIFPGSGVTEYNGTPGYPGFGAGPKWVGSLDTRFTTANDITFRWGVKYVGKQDAASFIQGDLINGSVPLPQPDGTTLLADYDMVVEPYWEHGASVQWNWRNVGQFTVGIRNVFNQKPPTFGGWPTVNGQYFRIGNYFAGGDYDFYGRSVFVNVTRAF